MHATEVQEFAIRRDGLPYKLLRSTPEQVRRFVARISARFPDHDWSVSQRFVLNGSD